MEKENDIFEVNFNPDKGRMTINQSGKIHFSLGRSSSYDSIDRIQSKPSTFFTLKGYKKMSGAPILTSNKSDAKNINSYYPDSPTIKIVKNESYSSGTFDNVYKGYSEDMLTEYFTPLIDDIRNEDYLTWEQEKYLNEKFSKTRKLVSKFYRIIKNGTHSKLEYNLLDLFKSIVKNTTFITLYEAWSKSDYNNDLEPSVVIFDRNSSYIDGFELCTVKDNKLSGRNTKKIGQYTLDGELLNVYNSIVDAVAKTDSTKSGICKVLYGDRKSHKGYFWKHQL